MIGSTCQKTKQILEKTKQSKTKTNKQTWQDWKINDRIKKTLCTRECKTTCQPIKAHQWILNTNSQISDYLYSHHASAMFVLPLVSFSICKYKVTADLQKHRGHWINEYFTETGNKQRQKQKHDF